MFQHLLKISLSQYSGLLWNMLRNKILIDINNSFLKLLLDCIRLGYNHLNWTHYISKDSARNKHCNHRETFFSIGDWNNISISNCCYCNEWPIQCCYILFWYIAVNQIYFLLIILKPAISINQVLWLSNWKKHTS